MTGCSIEIHALEVSVAGKLILGPLDLEVRASEYVCLLGHSGSGKSTLLRTIAGLQKATSGSIQLGSDVVCDSGREYVAPEKRGIGMLFQEGAAVAAHERGKDSALFPRRLRYPESRACEPGHPPLEFRAPPRLRKAHASHALRRRTSTRRTRPRPRAEAAALAGSTNRSVRSMRPCGKSSAIRCGSFTSSFASPCCTSPTIYLKPNASAQGLCTSRTANCWSPAHEQNASPPRRPLPPRSGSGSRSVFLSIRPPPKRRAPLTVRSHAKTATPKSTTSGRAHNTRWPGRIRRFAHSRTTLPIKTASTATPRAQFSYRASASAYCRERRAELKALTASLATCCRKTRTGRRVAWRVRSRMRMPRAGRPNESSCSESSSVLAVMTSTRPCASGRRPSGPSAVRTASLVTCPIATAIRMRGAITNALAGTVSSS